MHDTNAGARDGGLVAAAAGDGADGACGNCGAARGQESWCTRCLERYERPVDLAAVFPPARVSQRPHYSRFRSGPMSFGLPGRLTLSLIPAVVAFFSVRNLVRSRHDLSFAYYVVSDLPMLVLVFGFLFVVWRRARVS